MVRLLRHSRSLALFLLLLAPGIAGSGVQLLHACPAQAAAGSDAHHDSGSSHSDQAQTCECIGTCNAAGAVSLATPAAVRVAVRRPDLRITRPSGASFVPAGAPSHLLPPATAPPLS